MKKHLFALAGTLPNESGFKKRIRFHQGWWRAFVLAEDEGNNPVQKNEKVCNTILNGDVSKKNFLSERILVAVEQTIDDRKKAGSGIIEEQRLYNNLLSSQPLCFNFFGELYADKALCLKILQQYWPELTEVTNVIFEYSPKQNYTKDNSAFDVAFEVMSKGRSGFIGFECKYTDTFSSTEYRKPEYERIFQKGREIAFTSDYDEYTASKYNQLFRNQLIAEALVQNREYQFVYTGIFCHHDDNSALRTGTEFQGMLKNGEQKFKVITYRDFIEKIQKLDISWEQRELSMMLWARYCGLQLSDNVYK